MLKKSIYTIMILLIAFIICGCSVMSGDQLVLLGASQYDNGDYLKAIDSYKSAIEKGVDEYDLAHVHTCLGNAYVAIDMCGKAIDEHKTAIDLDDSNAIYWTNLGIAYRKNDDYDLAVDAYSKALELDSNYAEAYSSLGVIYFMNFEYSKAIENFESAIALTPDLASANGNCAIAYAAIGDFENAERYLEQSKILGYKNYQTAKDRIESYK